MDTSAIARLDHERRGRTGVPEVVFAAGKTLEQNLALVVRAPVIAVPTSVGYGAAFEGMAALLGMLTSCAPGIGVVNIDNGFGAAALAHKIVSAE
jgi:NCAIR mutase (PurE)-related protein